ncbi:metallopeptidase TldD-related protein [Massilia sp. B-10]|nr:metallopeptidase TldD-related protein [Massilia sp. B-10]
MGNQEIQVRFRARQHHRRQDRAWLAGRRRLRRRRRQVQKWDIIKDGILVNYQATRDQAHIINEKNRTAARMPTAGAACNSSACRTSRSPSKKKKLTPDQMVADVKKGIYIVGAGSFSIDQQRYNFQFGGQLFFEIKDGKIGAAGRRGVSVQHPGILECLQRHLR